MYKIAVMLSALLVAGCGVELLTTTAIQGELQAQQMSTVKRQVSYAADKNARIQLEHAVATFYAEKGYYPESLDALAPGYLAAIPTHADGSPFGYDPVTGSVLDQPLAGPTASDEALMTSIRYAIDQYGQTTGYYPGSLNDLVPGYLSEYPLTESGKPFVYDPQNGALSYPGGHPRRASGAATPNSQAVPMGGAGPLGEQMTGIAIQQQLNGMSNAGATSARGHVRNNVDNLSETHTQQQMQVMDDMGF